MIRAVTQLGVGSVFAGHRIESQIGEGGMGIVYLAEHLRLNRDVALKVVRPELSTNQAFRERFVQEAQLSASLDHPNIIPVYDAGEFEGSLYLTMRYVPGRNLRTVIDTESPLDPAWTLTVLDQVGSALDAAHLQGLVHRDVKPGNILLRQQGTTCYLTDFGLTKRTNAEQSLTKQGFFLGTLDYAAPEQITGRELDGRVDVYALGCVLFECLTGRRPFERDTDMALMWAHVNDPPPSVSSARPDLGTAWDPVVARALAKQPEARYPDCASLLADARAALADGAAGGAAATVVSPAAHPATTKVLPTATGSGEVTAQAPTAPSPPDPAPPGGGFGGGGRRGEPPPSRGRRAWPWVAG